MDVVVLAASPRPDGNSQALADAFADGARSAGHAARVFDLNERTSGGFLRDCRSCRGPDGECSIADGYRELMLEHVLRADAIAYATPLYWYGMAASLKNWFDRMTCYISASHPRSAEVIEGLSGKRAALLISSEERYPGATLGMIAQVQEMTRYLRQPFVGVVQGVGNRRGEVAHDPTDPLVAARRLGADLETLHFTDYRVETPRPGAVWGDADAPIGQYRDL
ncbi:flavodoxin family protein [Conexibacter woesei]|uniref:NAD(P)H dehydrogenase (Quinone) n=1 Tax=Conexibacter woesei (strain DSM 14684 / CCUG 47730 / CIP 108061 / JCM 11494 / NBRC 100937 / ID131577) TaxID=469383 RepID=D3F696_CONWI|nr:flavodoxin family protein [Conexibacter woesei]ADB48769.1 NAD(P)H dehydrogenase (quinone) [Conexibacter woesei DSM 14684]